MIGSRLSDRYEITSELGRGGMGVVYRARDPLLNRDVAVKLIPPSLLTPESEQRFQREAQVVAQMDHPSIVSIHDLGEHEGSLFFVMPLVLGTNLHQFRKRHSALGDIVDIAVQIAEALDYSHSRGVVHRDVKPDNVMVSEEAGAPRVRVMDFGLARATTESRLTKSGALVGTLAYLSPEQVMGREIDGRSDIYSLGVVLYECVVGAPPFQGDTQSVLYRIIHEVAQSPRALGADIDEELEAIVLACLEKDPARRPQRAAEVAEGLRRYRSRLRDSDRDRPLTGLTLATPRPVLAPFVGRAREFGELQKRLNAAVSGECQFVVVGGEPGIGKTRLLDELETLARVRRIRVLRGRSVEQDRSFAFQGFCELIQEHFQHPETGTSAAPPDLSDLAPELVSLFPMLSEIGEIRQAAGSGVRPSGASAAAPEDRTQIFELLARTITRIAAGKPLVLVLEDLHEAQVSIEALQYIVRRLGATPTLIVGSYRTTEVDRAHPLTRMLEGFRGDRRFSLVSLGPFSPSDHRQFVETLVGAGRLSDGLVKRLLEGTEGNPFFTKELVRSLVDSGGIATDDTGEWRLSGEAGLSAETLPATIQQVVEKRIERLPDEQREVLSVAAVIGRTFDARDLEALAEGKGDLDAVLDRLLQQGLVEEERESRGDRLTFSSGVVRDVLYGALPRRRRRTLHRRYAELLETRHAGRLERVLPSLVHHFSQGDVPDKTVEYALRQARSSLEAFSADEAARAAKTVLEFVDDEWEGDRALEGEARLLLARAQRMAGDIDAALKEASVAVKVFEQEKQPSRAVAALVLAAETAWQVRRTDEARRWVERGLASARGAGETESLRHLLSLAATLANLQGEQAKANEYLAEAARLGAVPGAAAAKEELPAGGRLVAAMAEPVAARDPAEIRLIEEEEVLANVFETLMVTDAEGHVVPALCESWEVRDRGRTFLLRLRGDVRFHDGHPLTAADVKASFERTIRRATREIPAALLAIRGVPEFVEGKALAVEGLVVRSEREVEVGLAEALPIYPALLSHERTAIAREAASPAASAPALVGTGPFRVASHEPGRVVLERTPDYWRGTPARLDAIEFRTGLRASTIAAGLRSGEFDLGRDLPPEDLEEILRDSRYRSWLVESPKENTYFVLFSSLAGPAGRNLSLRRALSGVLHTQDLVWRTLGRFAQPAVCLIPPGMLGHDPGRRNAPLGRDEAKELLRASGLGESIHLRGLVHPMLQDRYGSLLKTLFSIWGELGVMVDVQNTSMAEYLDAFLKGDVYDLMIGRWNADYDDPDNFSYSLFHSRAGRWRTWFSSPAADQLLEEARTETRPAAREALYRRFEVLLQESAAVAPLFHDIDYRLVSPRVRGLRLRGTAPYVDYSGVGKLESAAPEAEGSRADGGVLQVPIGGAVTFLDPARADAQEQVEVIPCVFETLTRATGDARVVPWLAAEVKAEDNGRRYRFRLRDHVRFHDGRRMSARDVRYSFERLLQSTGGSRWLFSPVRGAKALLGGEAGDLEGFRIHSAAEFSIELEEPVSFFPALVSYPAMAICPEGSDPGGSGPGAWAGTGPYRVVSFEPGRRLELERNRSYWRAEYPRSEGLVFSFGVPPEEILSGFRSGRFSLASDLLASDAEALRREPEFGSGYREVPRLVTYFVLFNAHRGPLADRALRERLSRAVDVPRVIRQTLGRLAIPAHGLIPPGLLGHEPSPARAGSGARPADVSMAPIELTALVNPVFFGQYAAVARELEAAFGEVGVHIRVLNKTIDEFLAGVKAGSADLSVGRWSADYPDTDTFVHVLHSQEGFNGRFAGLAEIDRLVERGRAETAAAVRHSVYRQIEETIAREVLMLPLFHEQAYRFARPEVEGLKVSFSSPAVPYEELRIRR
jgi:ABC-type transport system substrate-binding protein